MNQVGALINMRDFFLIDCNQKRSSLLFAHHKKATLFHKNEKSLDIHLSEMDCILKIFFIIITTFSK